MLNLFTPLFDDVKLFLKFSFFVVNKISPFLALSGGVVVNIELGARHPCGRHRRRLKYHRDDMAKAQKLTSLKRT